MFKKFVSPPPPHTSDFVQWLRNVDGLPKYVNKFEKHRLDSLDLCGEFTDLRLKEIKIMSKAHRKRIIEEAEKMKNSELSCFLVFSHIPSKHP